MFFMIGSMSTKTAKILTIFMGIVTSATLFGAFYMLSKGEEMGTKALFILSALFGFFFLIFLIKYLINRSKDKKPENTINKR